MKNIRRHKDERIKVLFISTNMQPAKSPKRQDPSAVLIRTATTMNRLAKKKKYYVRVRGYVTNNGKNYYGAWSKVKTIRTENTEEKGSSRVCELPF